MLVKVHIGPSPDVVGIFCAPPTLMVRPLPNVDGVLPARIVSDIVIAPFTPAATVTMRAILTAAVAASKTTAAYIPAVTVFAGVLLSVGVNMLVVLLNPPFVLV